MSRVMVPPSPSCLTNQSHIRSRSRRPAGPPPSHLAARRRGASRRRDRDYRTGVEKSSVSPDLLLALAFCLQNTIFSEWAMLGSNQRPPPCEGSTIACWRCLEIAKCLQIEVFLRWHFPNISGGLLGLLHRR